MCLFYVNDTLFAVKHFNQLQDIKKQPNERIWIRDNEGSGPSKSLVKYKILPFNKKGNLVCFFHQLLPYAQWQVTLVEPSSTKLWTTHRDMTETLTVATPRPLMVLWPVIIAKSRWTLIIPPSGIPIVETFNST